MPVSMNRLTCYHSIIASISFIEGEDQGLIVQANRVNGMLDTQNIRMLLSSDYMSSESSGEESDNNVTGYRKPVLKVKKLVWLQRKYRDAFHQIDRVYYQSHKSSRDKLKQRVQGDNSTREQPPNPHKFAVKFEFSAQDIDSLDISLSASFSSELNFF